MDKKTGFVLSNCILLFSSIFIIIKTKGSLPITYESITGPLIILILIIICYLNSDPFIYHKDKVKTGEYWRLLTFNLAHSSLIHLFFNVSGLILIWILFGDHFTINSFLLLFLFCSIICTIGIGLNNINSCEGASGVLMGLFIFGTMKDIKNKQKLGYLLFALICIKIIREQLYGSNMTDILESEVRIDIHLCGIIGGVLFFLL